MDSDYRVTTLGRVGTGKGKTVVKNQVVKEPVGARKGTGDSSLWSR